MRESLPRLGGYPVHIEREALVAHLRAKLTVLGRRLLVQRILIDGTAVAHADMVGVSRQTAWKRLQRLEAEAKPNSRTARLGHAARRGRFP
jgi:hypothetical protein